jgi:hypothetical protein
VDHRRRQRQRHRGQNRGQRRDGSSNVGDAGAGCFHDGLAAAMLREMPVAELSLNELSRRVGLAKSNVLRYFETREAVLLEL